MIENSEITGYKNLILAVFRGSLDDLLPIRQEDVDVVNKALNELSQRERDVIFRRFGVRGFQKSTLKAIGVEFGLSQERIRQIELKALRKSRHPSRLGWKIFFHSQLRQRVDDLSKIDSELRRELEKLFKRLSQLESDVKSEEYIAIHYDFNTRKILASSIDEYEFSVRARNCLINEGVKTIRDIVVQTEQQIRATKNMGQGTFTEIRDFLSAHGLNFGMVF